MIEAGRRGLNPAQPTAGDDFVPRYRDLRVATEYVGVPQLFGDAFLSSIHDLVSGSCLANLPVVAWFKRITQHNTHGGGLSRVTGQQKARFDGFTRKVTAILPQAGPGEPEEFLAEWLASN